MTLKYPKLTFFLLNLLIALLLLTGIGYFVLHYLDNYTRHGYSISVPSFRDLTPKQAEELAAHHKLQVIVIDSIYDENALPGTIQEQYPLEGSKVKHNRTIQLIMNARDPEQIALPSLANIPYRQTLKTLKLKGFEIGHIVYTPSEFKNLVLQLKHQGEVVEPGTLLMKGDTIDIVLGEGNDGNNKVLIPRLYKLKIEEASRLLKENYLNLGEIVKDSLMEADKDIKEAMIYLQDPPYIKNFRITAGTPVNIHVTFDTLKFQALDSLQMME